MIDESTIIKLYVSERFSGREISKKTGYALSTIQRVLKKHNVIRSLKEARTNMFQKGYKHPFKKMLDEKKIIHLYTEDNVSIPQIAKMFKCSLGPILRILKENMITTKSSSESHKGKPSYWKGKSRPDISVAMKGKIFSEEHKENLRKSHLGKKPSITGKTYDKFYGEKAKELKEKLRISHLGQISVQKGKNFEELYGVEKASMIKERLSQKIKERFSSEGARKTQSERILKFIEEHPEWRELKKKQTKEFFEKNPHYKEDHSKRMKEFFLNEESKSAMVERQKEYYKNHPEARQRISERQKIIWSTPEKRLFAQERRMNQKFLSRENKLELIMMEELRRRGIPFVHQFLLRSKEYKFLCYPDIAFPKKKIAVEVDGDYWHVNPAKYKLLGYPPKSNSYLDLRNNKIRNLEKKQIRSLERTRLKNIMYTLLGWKVLRFWESEIKKDVKKCVDEIEKAITFN